MAKVSFNKMSLKPNTSIRTIGFNDFEIEVKQYLPINQKLEMIGNVINKAAGDMKFYNVGKLDIFFTLEVLYNYTNINFTDKQKEDICKLYDIIMSSGLYDAVIEGMNKYEIKYLEKLLKETVTSIYQYQNSALGILDSMTSDYNQMDLDANTIYQKIADPENLELLKGIMTRLG